MLSSQRIARRYDSEPPMFTQLAKRSGSQQLCLFITAGASLPASLTSIEHFAGLTRSLSAETASNRASMSLCVALMEQLCGEPKRRRRSPSIQAEQSYQPMKEASRHFIPVIVLAWLLYLAIATFTSMHDVDREPGWILRPQHPAPAKRSKISEAVPKAL